RAHDARACGDGVDPSVVSYLREGYKEAAVRPQSLLKRHLTKDVLEKLKNKKTFVWFDSKGCGAVWRRENLDSGVGVYAPDAEAYSVFADLFDRAHHRGVPRRLQAHRPAPAVHAGRRQRVRRRGPGGKYVGHYKEMEDLVSGTLKGHDGRAEGHVLPLTGMTKEVQQQLIDDHFLFKGGRPVPAEGERVPLLADGQGHLPQRQQDVPGVGGRGGHMRIISMQKGRQHQEVIGACQQVVKAVNEIEKRMEFSHDDRLGFLTFCPTNLGTTIRASVHIKLPRLSAGGQEALQRVADRFQLQVRGSAGEHSEAVGGLYDISNKERMGLTEFEASARYGEGAGAGRRPGVVKYVEDGFAKLQASDSCHYAAEEAPHQGGGDRLKNLTQLQRASFGTLKG
uniref:Arginine kinase n=1 Tax=Macrostomum lignano TaxID=282301 RepID=A0A1I8F4J3_9PLAT